MSDPVATIHMVSNDGTSVPLSAYQKFVHKRYRLENEFDLRVSRDRMSYLMWYISSYTKMRAPMRVPFAREQVKWLLEPEEAILSEYSLPRIVDAYWRRALAGELNPYADETSYRSLMFWWCGQLSIDQHIEHVLVPDHFVQFMSLPANDQAGELFPASNFLLSQASFNPKAYDCSTPVGRLGSYLKLLMGRRGPYFSLFFPEQVLTFLNAITEHVDQAKGLGLNMAEFGDQLVKRLRKAELYREGHRLARTGRVDLAASTRENDDWETGEAKFKLPRPATKRRKAQFANEAATGERPAFLGDYEVVVIGPIRSQSGLGQATRMSIEALRSVGVEPALVDFYLDNPAPRMLSPENREPDPGKKRINLIHLNAESLPLAPAYLKAGHLRDAINIGYFFWELPTPAPCHYLALDIVDEIWVSSEFNRATYREATEKPVICTGIAVQPLPAFNDVDAAAIRRSFDIPADAFALISTFDSYSFLTRKNPAAAVRAFQAAFRPDENVRLVLKTQNMNGVLGESQAARRIAELRELMAGDDRIILIDETMPFADLIKLKSALDGYISLHRSEGWGYGLIESMQLKKPVIATDFSGNREFCNEETSLLVPWSKRYVKPNEYIFSTPEDYWAEPDIEAAARMIRQLRDDAGLRESLGEGGAKLVAERFSPEAVGKRYLQRLETLLGSRQQAAPVENAPHKVDKRHSRAEE